MPDPNSPEIPPGTAPIAGSKFGEAPAPELSARQMAGLSARSQVPTVGRIVRAEISDVGGLKSIWPAIVIGVINDDMVNLNVFTGKGVIVQTSVPRRGQPGYSGTRWDWPERM